ncbi:MAG: hypothetical protein J4F36_12920 [Nitrosopumilaceae archaeon]|nr:hypothetical protein [Nitrosopumilaceae archaeon]
MLRGFAKRLLFEGQTQCEVYRADTAVEPRCECISWEDKHFDITTIIEGHRKRYHNNVNKHAISIPSGANCHHTIKRIK